MKTAVEVDIAGKSLRLTNLEKVFYAQTGFTKGQMIQYYTDIAPAILPHLKSRMVTLKRYPDGSGGMFFYEKNCSANRPDWIRTAPMWSEGNQRDVNYCVIDSLPALVWAANLAAIELHTSLAKAPRNERPTAIAFDLDPGPPATILKCARVGLWLREKFEAMKLKSFPKTSGSKGLQIYVPLNTAATYDGTKEFAHALAQELEREHPEDVVSNMKKALRTNKVFIDWSQNDMHKTTVNVYSMRAREHPTVSTPVTWKEVEAALKAEKPELLSFEAPAVVARVKEFGDLFEPVLSLKQKIPKVLA